MSSSMKLLQKLLCSWARSWDQDIKYGKIGSFHRIRRFSYIRIPNPGLVFYARDPICNGVETRFCQFTSKFSHNVLGFETRGLRENGAVRRSSYGIAPKRHVSKNAQFYGDSTLPNAQQI